MGAELAPKARVPALDGLRGVAVAAVVANHVSPRGLRGGWLGVDIFFVLSGYLITAILVTEFAAHGRLDLRRFYARRARRLLPALIVLLLAVSIVARLAPNAVGFDDVRGDGASALAYVANWHFIAVGASYFNAFAPSPLRHLWSLAIEEQFYIVWPVLLLLVLKRFGLRVLGVVAALLACASAIEMALVFGGGQHISRAYFGTDTHAHGLLLGCALGVLTQFNVKLPYPWVVALLGLAGIGIAFARLDGTDPIAYRGGIAAIGLLTAFVIAALIASDGEGPAAWILQWRPVVGLGLISYGVYLWHWPVLEFVTAGRLGVSGWRLIVVQLTLTLALAIASFVLVERPVRRGVPRPRVSWIAAPAAVTAVVVTLVLVVPVVAPPYAVADQAARARSAAVAPLPRDVAAGPHARPVMLVGDSVAYTLFPGLVDHERASDVYFLNAAGSGCALDYSATATHNDDHPPSPTHFGSSCDWPRAWPALIGRAHPDLVVALWGLWDLFDVEIGHTWLRVGTPAWTRHMEATIGHAVDVLTAHGAHLVILTTQYTLTVAKWRVDALNAAYRAVAAARPNQVTVLDIQRTTDVLRPTRWDTVHYTAAGCRRPRWRGGSRGRAHHVGRASLARMWVMVAASSGASHAEMPMAVAQVRWMPSGRSRSSSRG